MNIVLAGIARSGTTLACSLLNELPQCVALHEPINPADLIDLDFPGGYLEAIDSFFAGQRAGLLSSGTAISKAREGRVPDNHFMSTPALGGLRPSMVSDQEVRFEKRLRQGFRLVVKHPNFFTATLGVLQTRYPCFAIIRNPLAVLLSWHTIDAPVNRGRLPFGEAFDEGLRSALASEPDRVARQIICLRWYFSRYAESLPRDHVIRYEDLVATGGRALTAIDPEASSLDTPLESRNANRLYDADLVREFAGRLLDDESIYAPFYRRDDIRHLCEEWPGGS